MTQPTSPFRRVSLIAEGQGRHLDAADRALPDHPFEDGEAVREPSSRKSRWSAHGHWWFSRSAKLVRYESGYERDQLIALDFDARSAAAMAQPMTLHAHRDAGFRAHTPDFFVRRNDGTAVLVDVRAPQDIEPTDQLKFDATEAFCGDVGWEYQLAWQEPGPGLGNLRWLAAYRHPRFHNETLADAVREIDEWPVEFGQLMFDLTERFGLIAPPALYNLLWHRDLTFDMADPLRMYTPVVPGELLWQRPTARETDAQ